jgi:hypothetical protein
MNDRQCLIWSFEHGQWWRANCDGYTSDIAEAGRYTLQRAVQICQNGLWSDPLQHGEAIVPLMESTTGARIRLAGLGTIDIPGPDDQRDCGDADERGGDGKRNADRA